MKSSSVRIFGSKGFAVLSMCEENMDRFSTFDALSYTKVHHNISGYKAHVKFLNYRYCWIQGSPRYTKSTKNSTFTQEFKESHMVNNNKEKDLEAAKFKGYVDRGAMCPTNSPRLQKKVLKPSIGLN